MWFHWRWYIYLFALILILVEYVERNNAVMLAVDFGQTGSTSVFVHAWRSKARCYCLVFDALTDCNCTIMYNYNGDDTQLCVDFCWICGSSPLAHWLWSGLHSIMMLYVGIGIAGMYLDLKVLLFGAWHTMRLHLHNTYVLFKYFVCNPG